MKRCRASLVALALPILLVSHHLPASAQEDDQTDPSIEVLLDQQVVIKRPIAQLPAAAATACALIPSVKDKDAVRIKYDPGTGTAAPPTLRLLRPDRGGLGRTDIGSLKPLVATTDASEGRMLDCRSLSLDSGDVTLELSKVECTGAGDLSGGGAIMVPGTDGQPDRALLCIADTPGAIVGDDIGITLNTLDRRHDDSGEKARYFEGASLYTSLVNFKSQRFRLIGNFSALDFLDDVELETGVGLGVLYRFRPDTDPVEQAGSFTLSLVYGYNLMASKKQDPEYALFGFGWSFAR